MNVIGMGLRNARLEARYLVSRNFCSGTSVQRLDLAVTIVISGSSSRFIEKQWRIHREKS
jgi:hypothetical protein